MGGVKKTPRYSEKNQTPERVILLVSVTRGRVTVILQCRPGNEAGLGRRRFLLSAVPQANLFQGRELNPYPLPVAIFLSAKYLDSEV